MEKSNKNLFFIQKKKANLDFTSLLILTESSLMHCMYDTRSMHPANENTKLHVTARTARSSFHQGKSKQMSNAKIPARPRATVAQARQLHVLCDYAELHKGGKIRVQLDQMSKFTA